MSVFVGIESTGFYSQTSVAYTDKTTQRYTYLFSYIYVYSL